MRIKLTKIKEREDAEVPNNISEGCVKEGELSVSPQIGKCFYMQYELRKDLWFRSSRVTEVMDDGTFKTLNSVYKIEEVKN